MVEGFDFPGVGKVMDAKLEALGIRTCADLRAQNVHELEQRFGRYGRRLSELAYGIDERPVDPDQQVQSISAEDTFAQDVPLHAIEPMIRELAAKTWSATRKTPRIGRTVVLKLKTADFRLIARSRRLDTPTQLAERLFRAAHALLAIEADGRRFRLIGIGSHDLAPAGDADPPDLLDPEAERQARVEKLIDEIRGKSGDDAIGRGRGFTAPPARRR